MPKRRVNWSAVLQIQIPRAICPHCHHRKYISMGGAKFEDGAGVSNRICSRCSRPFQIIFTIPECGEPNYGSR